MLLTDKLISYTFFIKLTCIFYPVNFYNNSVKLIFMINKSRNFCDFIIKQILNEIKIVSNQNLLYCLKLWYLHVDGLITHFTIIIKDNFFFM